MIAGSQTIAEDRTWFYLLRSSAITIAGSQAIAEVCFHMIADDRRTFCDLRSAIICDHMETCSQKAPLKREVELEEETTRKFSKSCDEARIPETKAMTFNQCTFIISKD